MYVVTDSQDTILTEFSRQGLVSGDTYLPTLSKAYNNLFNEYQY